MPCRDNFQRPDVEGTSDAIGVNEPMAKNINKIRAAFLEGEVTDDIIFTTRNQATSLNNGDVVSVKLRYKPKEVIGLFIEGEHEVVDKKGGKRVVRRTGWIVPGPGNKVLYIPEESLTESFEIIEEIIEKGE